MALEVWTMESGWKGSGHFQAGTMHTFQVIPIWVFHLCCPMQRPWEKLAALGYGRIWRGRSLSREDNSSNMALGYYMNKFMGCGFSSGAYTDQQNALLLNNENSSLQKGFEFLTLFDTYNNTASQIRSLLYSWSPQNRRSHTTFPSGSPLLEFSGQALSRTLYPHRTNLRCLW